MQQLIRHRRTDTTAIAPEEYFHIDEKSNAVDYLHRAAQFSQELGKDVFSWKWLMISLHSAIYHFMLLALQRTDLSGIWVEPEARDADAYIDDQKNNVVTFLEAFERVQSSGRMSQFVNSKPFQAQVEHYTAMRRLNDNVRNEFMHFHPKGWSIQKAYMAEIVSPLVEIIDFLASKSGNVHLDDEDARQVMADLEHLRNVTL